MRVGSKQVEKVVCEVAGEDVLPVVKLLRKKKALSEIKIAELAGMDINAVRNVLYRLYNHNLVFSERKRDKQNGWYFYQWSLSTNGLMHMIRNIYTKRRDFLSQQIRTEKTNHFYSCDDRCSRLEFDEAFNLDFKCPECGTILNMDTGKKEKIIKLKKEIEVLERAINGK